jgi:hypothetical protein
MAESSVPVAFDSDPSDGVLGVVTHAQTAVLAASEAPIGVLTIERMSRHDGEYRVATPAELAVGIEVAYTEHQGAGVIERLEVHVARELTGPPDPALVRAVLADHGGSAFTNVCLRRADGRELCDVTLHLGSKLAILAQHTALIEPELGASEVEAALAVLHELAIAAKRRGASFVVPRRALRRAPSPEAQARAFDRAVQKGLGIELYASTLPTARAARLSACPVDDHWELGLVLARRLYPESGSAARDAVAIRDFIKARFDFDFGGQRWRVDNAHGERAEHRPHGPVAQRQPLAWSLNWGTRKS